MSLLDITQKSSISPELDDYILSFCCYLAKELGMFKRLQSGSFGNLQILQRFAESNHLLDVQDLEGL